MTALKPKHIFREARREEKLGDTKSASTKYMILAKHFISRRNYKDALTLTKRALKLSPKSSRLYVQAALCENFQNNPEKAKEWIAEFVLSAARRKRLDHYRGYIEERLKHAPGLRRQFYESVLELDRTSVNWFIGLARAQIQLKENLAAKQTLVDVLKMKGDDVTALSLLKNVIQALGQMEHLYHVKRFEEDRLNREELVVLLSDYEPKIDEAESDKKGSLKNMIGALEEELGVDLEDKRDTIEPLLKEFRTQAESVIRGSATARIDMAMAYREMGLMDVARDEIEKIPQSDPIYISGQALLADILVEEGTDLRALEVLQMCIRSPETDIDTLKECQYKLIHVYLRLGDIKQAWIVTRKLAESFPDYRDLRTLQKQIEERLNLAKDSRRKTA